MYAESLRLPSLGMPMADAVSLATHGGPVEGRALWFPRRTETRRLATQNLQAIRADNLLENSIHDRDDLGRYEREIRLALRHQPFNGYRAHVPVFARDCPVGDQSPYGVGEDVGKVTVAV